MKNPSTERLDRNAPTGTLAALYQLELRRLADLGQQHDDLARRIAQQIKRVRAAEKLVTGGGQQ